MAVWILPNRWRCGSRRSRWAWAGVSVSDNRCARSDFRLLPQPDESAAAVALMAELAAYDRMRVALAAKYTDEWTVAHGDELVGGMPTSMTPPGMPANGLVTGLISSGRRRRPIGWDTPRNSGGSAMPTAYCGFPDLPGDIHEEVAA